MQIRPATETTPELRLKVSTSKIDGGKIVTRASVHTIEGNFETHKLFSDFSQQLQKVTARCTAANIERLHNDAIEHIDEICAAARAHYNPTPVMCEPPTYELSVDGTDMEPIRNLR
jgi:hypothetical protein